MYTHSCYYMCDAPNEAEELPMPMASSPRPSTLPAAQVRQYSWHLCAKQNVSDIRRARASDGLSAKAPGCSWTCLRAKKRQAI